MMYRSIQMTPSLARRTWWISKIESAVIHGSYSDAEVHREVRIRVKTEEEAFLIASLTENGYHAPALDFDFQVEVDALAYGVSRLTFPGRVVAARPWRKLLRRMAGLGLLREGFEDDPARWQDPTGRDVCMELAVPVRLLSSSTPGHHHLYLDAEMKWRHYRALCKAMERVGLLESEFVDLTISHGMSMLIKPGLTKKHLHTRGDALPGKDISKKQTPEYPA